MNWTGQQVAEHVRGVLRAGPSRPCRGVSTDTRTLAPGELYVPLEGERFDGHEFIAQAAERGCAGAVVRAGTPVQLDPRIHVEVPDTLVALGDLAAAWLRECRAAVVGITGSNGKTSTKEMAAVALAAYGHTIRNQGNFNNLVGLPLTALRVTPDVRYAVLEMGMNRPGEIARLAEIAQPRVGVVTNVAPAHLAGLGSIDAVAAAKGELFRGLAPDAVAVVNARDPRVLKASEGIAARRVTVGQGRAVDISCEGLRRTGVAGLVATLRIHGRPHDLVIRSLARHDIWNAALAVGVVVAMGLDPEPGLRALERYEGVRGRLTWRVTPDVVNVIDDTYNANPASTRAALETLAELGADHPTVAVLGDMLELGPEAIGQAAADMDIGHLVACGAHAADVARGYGADALTAPTATDAIDAVRRLAVPGAWVLVKGSRGMRMERVVAALCGEGQ